MPAMDMPSSGQEIMTLKRLRKGTKSCIECRHRKIRCVWGAPGDAICVGCKARGRECLPQIYQRRSINPDRLTSRDRIHRLEQQLANITAAVHDPNRQQSVTSLSPNGDRLPSEPSTPEEDPESEFDPTEGPAASPPSHLRFLFDNNLFGSQQADEDVQSHLSQARCSKRYVEQARSRFQRLMPPREDVLAVATYAAPWMALYMALFPATTSIGTKDELIVHFEKASAPEAHPVSMANFLLCFAVTALQAEGAVQLSGGKDAASFSSELCHVFDSTIVTHTGLATTLEGLEAIVMYLRLLLGIGSIRTLWLTLRRAIALAELMGLPRSAYLSNKDYEREMLSPHSSLATPRKPSTQRIAIWEAISSTDRLSSMMFNLPAATVHHNLPQKEIVSPETGEVMPRPYMFVLAGFAMRVQEIDEGYTLGQSPREIYEKVLATDGLLRAMKSKTPLEWWNESPETLSPGYLVQFWHYYLTARIHLNSAMNFKDEHDQYAYSRITCTDACERMARRYVCLRRLLPRGFFICRIIDMQVFTGATFLLLSCLKQGLQPDQERQELIQRILETMDRVTDASGAAFVRDAAAAIRSLASLAQTGHNGIGSRNLTLRIPFLGKVRIGRNEQQETKMVNPSNQQMPEQPIPPGDIRGPVAASEYLPQPPMEQSFDPQMASMMPWLMELDTGIPALADSFLLDDYPEFDQWNMNFTAFA